MWDTKCAAPRCGNTKGPLTHPPVLAGRGLAMQATSPARAIKPSPHPIPPIVAWRALTRCVYDPDTQCHISTYSVASHGYAQIGWSLKVSERTPGGGRIAGTLCHRAAWQAIHGPIEPGMTIDHLCKNRRCVNVAHLRLLTNLENARRNRGNDWAIGSCINGHDNEFFVERTNGKMHCMVCAVGQKQRALVAQQVSRRAKRAGMDG